jgi:hypothetical protein
LKENTIVKGIQMSKKEARKINEMAQQLAQEWLDDLFAHLENEEIALSQIAELSSTKYAPQ